MSGAGIASVEEIALMTVTENWIPIETIHDKTIIETLIGLNRRFTISMRYNLPQSKHLACAVLTDSDPLPTALYIVAAEAGEDFLAASKSLTEESHFLFWTWSTADFEMPALPLAGKL